MPKETIQDVSGTYDVRVGWSVDREVQVGVETAAGFSLVSTLYGDQDALEVIGAAAVELVQRSTLHGVPAKTESEKSAFAQGVGRALLDRIEASQSNPGDAPSYTGVWSTLDRQGVNKLIRVLRRARDAAYGADA